MCIRDRSFIDHVSSVMYRSQLSLRSRHARLNKNCERRPMTSYTIDVTYLNAAIRLVVRGFGSSDAEVEAVAGNLIEANLTGHDSHGIGMLPRYVDAYQQGGLTPNQHVRTVLDAGTLLRLDGGAG